jgi:hypothetical protein
VTVILECTLRGGKVVPLDKAKIDKWKTSHREGAVFDMILSDATSTGQTALAKKFHAIRDEYAAINGYTNDFAKVELKVLHGVVAPDAPTGRTGRIVEYHGNLLWLLSIRDYTTEELQRLVQGSDLALQEASV